MHASTNYLYILAVIGYFIYTFIKAGKKAAKDRSTLDNLPKQSPTVQPPTASPKPDMQSEMKKMLEDLLGVPTSEPAPVLEERKIESVKPQPAKIITHTPQKEKIDTAKEKLLASHAKANADILSHAKQPKAAKKVLAETVEAEEPAVDFDIRQAIIFSEILKRPEY